MMKLIELGYISIIRELEKLEPGWDGYKGNKIMKKSLDKFKDMTELSRLIGLFKAVGFIESDIDVVPTSEGKIQLEAERKDRYFEITI